MAHPCLRRGAAALALLAAGSAGAVEADPAFGHWLVDSGKAIVRLGPCGESACAEVVWLESEFDEQGEPRRDARNPDPALRDRTMCGLEIMWGLRREAPGDWRNGHVYNGRDGKTYGVRLSRQEDGTLKVRGYLGVPLLGKSQVWTPVEDDRGGCEGV